MIDIIIASVILIAVGGASIYIYRAKKNGQACIGCPNSKECGGHKCSGGCPCCSTPDFCDENK